MSREVATTGGVTVGAKLALKRWVAKPYPMGSWTSLLLLIGASAAIGSLWGSGRLWLIYHRPVLAGVSTNSDAGPDPTALFIAAGLLVLGLGLAASLALARRCPVRSRWIALAGLATGVAALLASIVGQGERDARCSEDHYSGNVTCVSGDEAQASDVRNVLVPSLLTLGGLALGTRIEKRRVEAIATGQQMRR